MTVHRANRKKWKVGDLVIHDRDAKEQRMLRVVVAVLGGGWVRTVFHDRSELPANWRGRVFLDRMEELHDPRRFHISKPKRKRRAA